MECNDLFVTFKLKTTIIIIHWIHCPVRGHRRGHFYEFFFISIQKQLSPIHSDIYCIKQYNLETFCVFIYYVCKANMRGFRYMYTSCGYIAPKTIVFIPLPRGVYAPYTPYCTCTYRVYLLGRAEFDAQKYPRKVRLILSRAKQLFATKNATLYTYIYSIIYRCIRYQLPGWSYGGGGVF